MATVERWDVRFERDKTVSFIPRQDIHESLLTLERFHQRTRSYFNPDASLRRDTQLSVRVLPDNLVSQGDRVIQIYERLYAGDGNSKDQLTRVDYSPSTIDLFRPMGWSKREDIRGQYLINTPDSISEVLPDVRVGWIGSHPYIEADSTARLSVNMSVCTLIQRGVQKVSADMFYPLQSIQTAYFSPTTPHAVTLRIGPTKMPVLVSIIYPEGGKADFFDVIVNPQGLLKLAQMVAFRENGNS